VRAIAGPILGPPQNGFDSGQELAQMKWLRQIVVGPHFKTDDAVDGLAAAGQDDDAYALIRCAVRAPSVRPSSPATSSRG
jgi:hypothetical protein